MGRRRLLSVATTLMATVLLATGCEFTGINSMPLPFTEGGGDDDLRVTVVLNNATNLVPNSEVRYGDVEVGSVRRIEFDDWTARLTLGINADARIPADVTARVAQKSLLGAEYLELASPSVEAGHGVDTVLADHAEIGLDRTGRYPETEEVLSAAALLLNNGGLPQIRTIAHELNNALDGRTADVTSLVTQLSDFTGALAAQRDQVVGLLEELDRFARAVNHEEDGIATALNQLPKGIDALRKERAHLVEALQSVDDLSGIAHRVVTRTEDGLVTNLANLRPLTRELSENAETLAASVDEISFPFPIRAINNAFFGDYINFFALVDLDLATTARLWTAGTPLEALVSLLLGIPPTATEATDPLEVNPGTPDDIDDPRNGGPARPSEDPLTDPGLSLDALLGGLLGGGQ